MGHEPHHLSDFKCLRHVCTFTNGKKMTLKTLQNFLKLQLLSLTARLNNQTMRTGFFKKTNRLQREKIQVMTTKINKYDYHHIKTRGR